MRRFMKTGQVYVLLLMTLGHFFLVHTEYSFKLAFNGRCLRGNELRSLTIKTAADCFLACVDDCLCLAFQIFDHTVCQLLLTTRFITPVYLVGRPGCLYYDMFPEGSIQPNTCQTRWSCSCPCLNRGTCEALISPTFTKRFRCRCRPGYSGNYCQNPTKSCRGYTNGSRVPGTYKVFDANMTLFDVFCDFDTKENMAWTLIQSYQLQNNAQFKRCPFLQDHPEHEDTPVWDSYRLSKSRMESIQKDSSKWRMTCRYDSDGLNYTDYVRGSNDKVNILAKNALRCRRVEFIDIRGNHCVDCKAMVGQSSTQVIHFDSYHSSTQCPFKPNNSFSCDGPGEDNFGVYHCLNPSHRCSSSPTSTSQTWFGGKGK